MTPTAKATSRPGALAGYAFVVLTALFGLAVLLQIFFAGEAALIAPEDWQWHIAWIHLFQWTSLALPVSAYAAKRKLGFAALNCIPILIIGLQYVLIHRAVSNLAAPLAGVHAVGGALLVGFVAFVLQDWRLSGRLKAMGT